MGWRRSRATHGCRWSQTLWEEFGQMLMSHEGWQFKLELVYPSDDV